MTPNSNESRNGKIPLTITMTLPVAINPPWLQARAKNALIIEKPLQALFHKKNMIPY